MNLKSLKISTALIAMLATTSAFASFQSDEEGEVAKTHTRGQAGKKAGQARQPKQTASKKSATAAQEQEIGEDIGGFSPLFSRLSAHPRALDQHGHLEDAQGHASFLAHNTSFLSGFVHVERSDDEDEVGSEDEALSGLKSAREKLSTAHDVDSDDEVLSGLKSAKQKLSKALDERKEDDSGSSSSSSDDSEESFNEDEISPEALMDIREAIVSKYARSRSALAEQELEEKEVKRQLFELQKAEDLELAKVEAKEEKAKKALEAKVKDTGVEVAKDAAKVAKVAFKDKITILKGTAPAKTSPVKPAPKGTAPAKTVPAKTAPKGTAPAKTVPAKTAPAKVIPTPTWASMPQNTEGATTYGMHDNLKALPVLSHSLASKPNATVISATFKAMTQSEDYTAEAYKKAYGKTATETKVTAAVVLTNVIKKALDATKNHALPMIDGKKDFEGRFQADATKALEFSKAFAQATAMNFAHTIKAVQKSDKSVDYIIWNTNGNCAFATLNFKKVA